jgi:uncharacterized membrane protein YeaQ/YmgE (transglycosylase-associated protein family)
VGLIVALLIGGIVGWLWSLARSRSSYSGRLRGVLLGIFGALLGVFVLGPVMGGGNVFEAQFFPMTPVISLIGAVVWLGLITLVRGGLARRREGPDEPPLAD